MARASLSGAFGGVRGRAPGFEELERRALLATVTVHVADFQFSTNPTIHVGDTVEWVWDNGMHSTTSVAGSAESWDSGVHMAPFTFDHTFTHAGTFNYYCRVHGFDNHDGTAGGMSGSVTVLASVSLTSIGVSPANPTVVKGHSLQLDATGHFSDGSTQDLTSQVTWASLSPAFATVSASGLVTGVAAGSSTVTASLSGMTGSTLVTVTQARHQALGDYDGDGKADFGVYMNGTFVVAPSAGGKPIVVNGFGGAGWQAVSGDYDGDGKADFGVYRNGTFVIAPSSGGKPIVVNGFGGAGWQAVTGDFDGDGKTDFGAYHNGTFVIAPSSGGKPIVVNGLGGAGWQAISGDYDGDGKADFGAYFNGTFVVAPSSGGKPIIVNGFGGAGWQALTGVAVNGVAPASVRAQAVAVPAEGSLTLAMTTPVATSPPVMVAPMPQPTLSGSPGAVAFTLLPASSHPRRPILFAASPGAVVHPHGPGHQGALRAPNTLLSGGEIGVSSILASEK
jgi:plastocyanin